MRRLLAEPTEYNLLEVSAILRLFLFDEHPLITDIRKITGQPIKFQTRAQGMVEWAKAITGNYPDVFSACDSIGPGEGGNISVLNIDQFRTLPVLVLFGDVYTVADVVGFCTNTGGVHHRPTHERLKDMLAKPEIQLMGMSIITQLVRGIADAMKWVCRPHEIFVLNQLGCDALRAGAPLDAVQFFEDTIQAGKWVEAARPDLWELFHSNLASAREMAANMPIDPEDP